MVSRKFTRKEIALIISITLFILGILTFYIWHQAESIRLGYETQELEEKTRILKKEVEKLEAEKASLMSLDKVEKTAKENLNMTKASEDQIFYSKSLNPDETRQ